MMPATNPEQICHLLPAVHGGGWSWGAAQSLRSRSGLSESIWWSQARQAAT